MYPHSVSACYSRSVVNHVLGRVLDHVLGRTLLLLMLLVVGATGRAMAAVPTRAEIEARLRKSPTGLSSAELAELGAGAGILLVQIADDRAVAPPIRMRAMGALAYVRTPAAHDFLENFVIRKRPSSDAVDRSLLRKAAGALGWQSGPRCVEILATLLDHPDAEVRLDAVVALGLTRVRAAEKPLRDRLAAETEPAVRAQIENQLKVIAEAGAPVH
jgi:HEAT repeats